MHRINNYSTGLMKSFFKFMFASMLGVFLSLILLIFLFAGIIAIMVNVAGGKEIKVSQGTILHIDLQYPLTDRSSDNPLEGFDFTTMQNRSQPGLNEILKNLEKASKDANIEGIFLDLSGDLGGMASMEELRSALLEFRKSGKYIYSYSDYYTQANYYLASVSDKIWLNPEGEVDFRGMAAQLPFIKGLLEKLEIEPQVIRHGKFKSAVEPFIQDQMSEENREQTTKYVDSFWNHIIREISFTRKLKPDVLTEAANNLTLQTSGDALQIGLVDQLGYRDEFLDMLRKKSKKKKSDKLNFISLSKYRHAPETGIEREFTRDKIAVIYASGNIVQGKGGAEEIGGLDLSETIRKARENKNIKAVVLRVNSPGGDALASEVIWREVELCSKEKPVIVSMGDLAASGGYYISCAADRIVAQPNTITGSIGVFGILFNAGKMFKNKLGITFDQYKTGNYSDLGNMTRSLTEAEKAIIQNSVERVYATFTRRVSEGRNMSIAAVDSIGQGRVWSGADALAIGLVDTLGGLDDAIAIAARKAKISNYRITELPEKKDPFRQLITEFTEGTETRYLQRRLGKHYSTYRELEYLSRYEGIQARMPLLMGWN